MRSRGNCAPDSLGPLVRANWRQTAIYIATNCTAPRLLSDGYHPTARLGNNLTGQQQIPLDFWDLRNQEIDISFWSISFTNQGQLEVPFVAKFASDHYFLVGVFPRQDRKFYQFSDWPWRLFRPQEVFWTCPRWCWLCSKARFSIW